MRRRTTPAVLLAVLLMAGAYWAGCGGDDDNDPSDTATFFGDVAAVTGSSASLERRTTLASRWLLPRLAWAQSTCPAPSDGRLLFCVDEFCTTVDQDFCDFRVVAVIEGGGPVSAVLRFVDDENEDGEFDDAEDDSVVTQNLVFCTGDEVEIADAIVNFATGITTANVRKVVDNCGASTPTPTRTGGTPAPTNTPGAPTPTRTLPPATATAGAIATATARAIATATALAAATATSSAAPTTIPTATGTGSPTGTATPAYGYGVAMNATPRLSWAFLASLGVIGLLIPRRKRR